MFKRQILIGTRFQQLTITVHKRVDEHKKKGQTKWTQGGKYSIDKKNE